MLNSIYTVPARVQVSGFDAGGRVVCVMISSWAQEDVERADIGIPHDQSLTPLL